MYKSPLDEMTQTTDTQLWNDSCSEVDIKYALEHGCVGATTNPVIVADVLKKEMSIWKPTIEKIIKDNPTFSEVEIAWGLIETMAKNGAKLFEHIFNKTNGQKGRLSIQTNAQYYRDAIAMADQAEYFSTLAPNFHVKMPVTEAGIKALEESTYRGVSINATVSFSVSQCLAVAEAVDRGLKRREKEGKPTDTMAPVCTMMVGRIDDWLKVVMQREGLTTNRLDLIEWAGVSCFKNAYKIYQQRGYRTKVLAAAYRNHLHWSQFIGGDCILTITPSWQKLINACEVPVKNRINDEVDGDILDELKRKFPEFVKAYDENGLTIPQFDTYGATVRTLRQFHNGYSDLLSMIRDVLLPNPD